MEKKIWRTERLDELSIKRTETVDFSIAFPRFGDAFSLNGASEFIIFAIVRTVGLICSVCTMLQSIALQ